jgi:hypothetical protein
MKTVLLIVLVAVCAAAATALVLRPGNVAASTATTYRLKRGDFARIPALGWTCNLSRLPGSRESAFFCTSDSKPIASVWFAAHRVFVSTGRPPARFKNGYVFNY